MEEAKLLRRLKRQNTSALEEIIDIYSRYVSTIVTNIIGGSMTHEDVEEVVSDVFFTLWNQAELVKKGKLKAYLSKIARNKAINKLRQKQAALPLEEDEILTIPENELPENILLEKEQKKIMLETLFSMECQTGRYFCGTIITARR